MPINTKTIKNQMAKILYEARYINSVSQNIKYNAANSLEEWRNRYISYSRLHPSHY